MPLQITSLNEIFGLATEGNPISQLPPNTLSDCRNVVFSRPGFVFSRKGHPSIAATIGSSIASQEYVWINLLPVPTFPNRIIVTYKSRSGDALVDNVAYFDGSTFNTTNNIFKLINGVEEEATTFSRVQFGWNLVVSHQTFTIPRSVVTKTNNYIAASNGVFRSIYDTGNLNNFKKYKKFVQPLLKSFAIGTIADGTVSDSLKWLQPGFRVQFVALLKEQIGDSVFIEGKPSHIIEVTEYSSIAACRFNATINNFNLGLNTTYLEIYRTVQYEPIDRDTLLPTVPPIDFFKCFETELSLGSIVGEETRFINVFLPLNDDAIQQFERLYTNINLEGVQNRNSVPPTAKDVIIHKGYAVYGNLYRPPYAKLVMTKLPTSTTNDILRVGGVQIGLTPQTNSERPPHPEGAFFPPSDSFKGIGEYRIPAANVDVAANTFQVTITSHNLVDGTAILLLSSSPPAPLVSGTIYYATDTGNPDPTKFKLASTYANALANIPIDITTQGSGTHSLSVAYTLVIRPVDPRKKSESDIYGVPTYITIDDTQPVTTDVAAGSPRNIYVPLPSTANADLSNFPESTPGIAAITNNQGFVRFLFTYSDYQFVTTTTPPRVEFVGCTPIGVPFPGSSTLITAEAGRNLWYLPGTSVQTLPIYPLGPGTFAPPNAKGYSLLPTFQQYPGIKASQLPLFGVLADPKFANNGTHDYVVSTINFLGIGFKTEPKRLDDSVKAYISLYNESRSIEDPYAEYIGEPATIYFEGITGGYSGASTYTSNTQRTSGAKFYDQIQAVLSDTAVVQFDQNILKSVSLNVVGTNISFDDPQVRNGLVLSKSGRPEAIPNRFILDPYRVGDDLKGIQRLVSLIDSLYVFKEEEGIYRVEVAEGTIIPEVLAINLVDPTTWLIAEESLEKIQESAIFLANKGFMQLAGNQLVMISSIIEKEVKDLSAKVNLSQVRSFSNEVRRLYGCFFPAVNSDGTGITYVYDLKSNIWSKWDLEFDDAYTKFAGHLTTIAVDRRYTTVPTTTNAINAAIVDTNPTSVVQRSLKQDVISSGQPLDGEVDQYDEVATFTGVSTASNTITMTKSSTATSFGLLPYRVKNKQLWYSANGTFYPVTITNIVYTSNIATSITVSLDGLTSVPFVPSTVTDKLYVGVNSSLTFNRFYTNTPHKINQWSRFQVLVTSSLVLRNLKVAFQTDLSGGFTSPLTFGQTSDIFNTYVPRNAARGRFIVARVTHDTPLQIFNISGLAWEMKAVSSFKGTKRDHGST